jgi:hypothetical protein
MLEPYAMKVARTVLRGGKFEKTYLSQLETPVVHAVNDECRTFLIKVVAKAKTLRLGSTAATHKLKGITGSKVRGGTCFLI